PEKRGFHVHLHLLEAWEARPGVLPPVTGSPIVPSAKWIGKDQVEAMPAGRLTRREAKDRTRRRLLQAARRQILAGGETRLSASSVARRAGVAGATFYEHFANRDELLRAL